MRITYEKGRNRATDVGRFQRTNCDTKNSNKKQKIVRSLNFRNKIKECKTQSTCWWSNV